MSGLRPHNQTGPGLEARELGVTRRRRAAGRRPGSAGVPAGQGRRACSRTDLPGGAVPQHDDFQLPVLALLLRVRHGVPRTRPAPRGGGGKGRRKAPGAGERRKGGSGCRTPAPVSPRRQEGPEEDHSAGAILPTSPPSARGPAPYAHVGRAPPLQSQPAPTAGLPDEPNYSRPWTGGGHMLAGEANCCVALQEVVG